MINKRLWLEGCEFSIVVQGAIFASNCIETAINCRHWRDLFPGAEIVLSVSSSDMLDLELAPQVAGQLAIDRKHKNNSTLNSAVRVIEDCCDRIVFADHALPLPPIKSDSPKLNNANLQIAAAKAGLGAATGRYVLRVRSDFVFQDSSFLEKYLACQSTPRGDFTAFSERLLIANIYTVNPLAIERLPFHYSDWFHLGPMADVRDYWNVPLITLKDAVFYTVNPHMQDSYRSERFFNIRVAVEQHLAFSCFQRHFPKLKLDFHNDLRCVEESLAILRDNFIVCDLAATKALMRKYETEMHDYKTSYACINETDWWRLANNPTLSTVELLSEKAAEAASPLHYDNERDFPRYYPARRLQTKIGRIINGDLVAFEEHGVISFGPFCRIPKGSYIARVRVASLVGPGKVELVVTAREGAERFASRTFVIWEGRRPQLEVHFDVTESWADKVECVCDLRGIREFALSGVEFLVAESQCVKTDFLRLTSDYMSPSNCRLVGEDFLPTQSNGLIFHGPYLRIKGGAYEASCDIAPGGSGGLFFRLMIDHGACILAEHRVTVDPSGASISIPFILDQPIGEGFEFVCYAEEASGIRISNLAVTRSIREKSDQKSASVGLLFWFSALLKNALAKLTR